MFDNLLCGKFSKKCKHGIKCINSRLLLIKKKKQATIKFSKKDVADLLANRHDSNAFGRIEAILVEINLACCYDMIENYCQCILNLLPSLQKLRECPEEAKEAISTLIFAAARFSDLPELYDLRQIFTERYGSQMESSVNAEFVEKLQKKSFSTDMKLQLMKSIADEFSVTWDPRAFQQILSNPTQISLNKASISNSYDRRPSNIDSNARNEAMNTHLHKSVSDAAVETNFRTKDHISYNNRKETMFSPDITITRRKEATSNSLDSSFDNKKEKVSSADTLRKARNGVVDKSQKQQVYPEPKDVHVIPTNSNGELHYDNSKNGDDVNSSYVKLTWAQNRTRKNEALVSNNRSTIGQDGSGLIGIEIEVDMTPPYTILKGVRNGSGSVDNGPIHDDFTKIEKAKKPIYDEFPKPEKERKLAYDDFLKTEKRVDATFQERKPKYDELPREEKRFDPSLFEKSSRDTPRPLSMIPPPYTKSKVKETPNHVPKPPTIVDKLGTVERQENEVKQGRKKHEGRRQHEMYDGDCDEEDEIMDRLLKHLSRKGFEEESSKRRSRARAPHAERVSSLPSESVSPVTGRWGHCRATSMQPDLSDRSNMRVSDYDDLTARFMALKRS